MRACDDNKLLDFPDTSTAIYLFPSIIEFYAGKIRNFYYIISSK